MTLDALVNVDPSKECLKFLKERVLSDNYRGKHTSQHQRYTFDDVLFIFQTAYDLVGTNKMVISTTDVSKKDGARPDEIIYYEFCDRVVKKCNKFTIDAMRKNLFPDFHRMGFINRYNKDGRMLGGFERSNHIMYFSLTDLAIQLLNAKTLLDKQTIFVQRIEVLFQGSITDIIELLRDEQIDYITMDEYMFFISGINQSFCGLTYDFHTILKYLKEYKLLTESQKRTVNRIVKAYCDERCGKKGEHLEKPDKRDFGNWKNEAQQVFMLASFTAYFNYDKQTKRLLFMVAKNAIFTSMDDIKRLKRSSVEKSKYFSEHQISKVLSFELHHIVPLLLAKSAVQFFLLDRWQNMLYIDGGKHAYISQSGNIHIKLDFDNNDIILSDTLGNSMKLNFGTNVIYGIANKQVMTETNVNLLASF
jgi:predicted NAD-dependent protein-ADP-ribosyltransferase YbiA (DUF1768 family)